MDVLTGIKTRRSIGKVKSDPVPKEMIETILEAGTWAPCHHQTEPWRFLCVNGGCKKESRKSFRGECKGNDAGAY